MLLLILVAADPPPPRPAPAGLALAWWASPCLLWTTAAAMDDRRTVNPAAIVEASGFRRRARLQQTQWLEELGGDERTAANFTVNGKPADGGERGGKEREAGAGVELLHIGGEQAGSYQH